MSDTESLKKKLTTVLQVHASYGKGPFEAWAEGRSSRGVKGMRDRELESAFADAYGGPDVLSLLQGAGLSAVYTRDAGRVLGAARAQKLIAGAIQPAADANADPEPNGDASISANPNALTAGEWFVLIGGIFAIIAAVTLVIIFFAAILQFIGWTVIVIGLATLFCGPGYRWFGYVGFLGGLVILGWGNHFEHKNHPHPTSQMSAVSSLSTATSPSGGQ